MSDSDSTQKKSKSSKIKKFIMEQFDKTNDKLDSLVDLKLSDLHYWKQPDSDSDADMVVQGCPRRMSSWWMSKTDVPDGGL